MEKNNLNKTKPVKMFLKIFEKKGKTPGRAKILKFELSEGVPTARAYVIEFFFQFLC